MNLDPGAPSAASHYQPCTPVITGPARTSSRRGGDDRSDQRRDSQVPWPGHAGNRRNPAAKRGRESEPGLVGTPRRLLAAQQLARRALARPPRTRPAGHPVVHRPAGHVRVVHAVARLVQTTTDAAREHIDRLFRRYRGQPLPIPSSTGACRDPTPTTAYPQLA